MSKDDAKFLTWFFFMLSIEAGVQNLHTVATWAVLMVTAEPLRSGTGKAAAVGHCTGTSNANVAHGDEYPVVTLTNRILSQAFGIPSRSTNNLAIQVPGG
uniref:Putative secreted protein n=1 Tax=Anopheles darlingi TaxID=43151 RepID=A0A2M4D612_ANODA